MERDIMEEASGGGIMEESSWRRHHGGVIHLRFSPLACSKSLTDDTSIHFDVLERTKKSPNSKLPKLTDKRSDKQNLTDKRAGYKLKDKRNLTDKPDRQTSKNTT